MRENMKATDLLNEIETLEVVDATTLISENFRRLVTNLSAHALLKSLTTESPVKEKFAEVARRADLLLVHSQKFEALTLKHDDR